MGRPSKGLVVLQILRGCRDSRGDQEADLDPRIRGNTDRERERETAFNLV